MGFVVLRPRAERLTAPYGFGGVVQLYLLYLIINGLQIKIKPKVWKN